MADRTDVLGRLKTDLIGPGAEDEVLTARPSDVYLTGILWPRDSGSDPEADDRLDTASGDDDDAGSGEAVRASAVSRPSAAGVSFAVHATDGNPRIEIEARFAVYEPALAAGTEEGSAPPPSRQRRAARWQRVGYAVRLSPIHCTPGSRIIEIASPPGDVSVAPAAEDERTVPAGIAVHLRTIANADHMLVTATLLNNRTPEERSRQAIEEAALFQTELLVRPAAGTTLRARPSRRAAVDADDDAAALLYRDAHEYAAGHTCGADWTAPGTDGGGGEVRTSWMPQAIVPATSALGHAVFTALGETGDNPLLAGWLAEAPTGPLCTALRRLPSAYRDWISLRREELTDLSGPPRAQAEQHLRTAEAAAAAMESCINDYLARDEAAAEAFRLANLAMRLQFDWAKTKPEDVLRWRPFQLGFMLLAMPSLMDPAHSDRGTMDLLWFPTGGGKTEAYLALIAFLAFFRRLRNKTSPDAGDGVAAIMRYTLRLLTTQQFERASAMILACEVLRRRNTRRLGGTPFSIGLWVGSEATPNTYRAAAESLRTGNPEIASPRQLTACPACRARIDWQSDEALHRIEARCLNRDCVLGSHDEPLPVWTVDEDVYRERPTLLIGTIDKFAQIARGVAWRSLFGLAGGQKPDLIIQDELHLISGPLGTIAGIYETAIDRLLEVDGAPAKVIGSTATIRRAEEQIRAVFNRDARLFPPPGLSADDSGFAVQDRTREGRLYVGVTTAGRSAKFTLQAVAASLLQSGGAAFGGDREADAYKTLVTYFNSLRELGGALVLMQDDVMDAIEIYASQRNEATRGVEVVEELTSRRSQAEVRDMLRKLAYPAGHAGMLDVVLASNMLSVGVDVQRLGLMIVNGQPKGIAEYIQATSRIGRGSSPGLVVTLLNNAKARDRSHYETFRTWHETLYRDVEATSVTPFAARARDRALHAALVVLVRTLVPGMANRPDLSQAAEPELRAICDWITARAASVDPEERNVSAELDALLEEWERRAPDIYWQDWRPSQSLLQSAERAAMRRASGREPGAAWPTMNNMRSVEPSVHFRLAEALRSAAAGSRGGSRAE